MANDLKTLFQRLKEQGLTAEQEAVIRRELNGPQVHPEMRPAPSSGQWLPPILDLYQWHDQPWMGMTPPRSSSVAGLHSLDELLDRDRRREDDGFPRKIRVGRMIKPGKRGKEKVVVVPTTVEEKLMHDPNFTPQSEGDPSGGSGDGEEGEVIGEQPVRPQQQGEGSGPGQGEGGQHEVESSAYDLGRILTETFQLPNLREKGKKRSLTKFTYELTDRNRGVGQVLDKKNTLRQVVKTNIALGNIQNQEAVDPTEFIISPADRVYRTLSQEKDYESQAMVFFMRDYSGSMAGKSTELVVSQHVLIYSWLLYQYSRQVESRFILHDTEAREVDDFYTYYNSKVAGGTQVSAAYKMVNEIVEKENLASEYNIYIFHGTDGDDWDTEGKEALPELKKMLNYASRVGVTIAEHSYTSHHNTQVEKYLKNSGLLESRRDRLRLDVLQDNAGEQRLIDGIKDLTAD